MFWSTIVTVGSKSVCLCAVIYRFISSVYPKASCCYSIKVVGSIIYSFTMSITIFLRESICSYIAEILCDTCLSCTGTIIGTKFERYFVSWDISEIKLVLWEAPVTNILDLLWICLEIVSIVFKYLICLKDNSFRCRIITDYFCLESTRKFSVSVFDFIVCGYYIVIRCSNISLTSWACFFHRPWCYIHEKIISWNLNTKLSTSNGRGSISILIFNSKLWSSSHLCRVRPDSTSIKYECYLGY